MWNIWKSKASSCGMWSFDLPNFYKTKLSLGEKYLRFLTSTEKCSRCLVKALNPYQLPPWPHIWVLHFPSFFFSKTQWTQNADLSSFRNRCSKYSLIHTQNIMVMEILLSLGRAWTPWQTTFRECTFISRTRLNLSSDFFVTSHTITLTLILLASFFFFKCSLDALESNL